MIGLVVFGVTPSRSLVCVCLCVCVAISVGCVCRTWHELANTPALWKRLCQNRWEWIDQHHYQYCWKRVYQTDNLATKHLSHRWEIANFSDITDERVYSPDFQVSNTSWYALLHDPRECAAPHHEIVVTCRWANTDIG
jgi:hypothetical protein